jgi:transposase-like protein
MRPDSQVRASRGIINTDQTTSVTSEERDRIKALEREVGELRQANEVLRKASAYVAMAELDRRHKP